jgi:ferredoxin-NADP reductase
MATISKATVVKVTAYGNDVREYILQLDKYNYFDPGTFVQLALAEPQNNRWPESRNFSIASYSNNDKTIRLVIRRIGSFTARIFSELEIGSVCYLKYSFGDFLLPYFDKTSPIVCIAGGTGVAPFLSFAEFLAKEGDVSRMHLYYSAKNSQELICANELKVILPVSSLNIHLTRESNSQYHHGRIDSQNLIETYSAKPSTHFFICGGEEFTNKFKLALVQSGFENVHTDEW